MDPFHARLARIALVAAGPYGFALAGGYAVQAHGFLDRPSADVDIFTTSRAEEDFPAAVDAVLAALRDDGLVRRPRSGTPPSPASRWRPRTAAPRR
jgi:hypothetical protein